MSRPQPVLPLAVGRRPRTHVRELPPDSGLPAGFRASGVAAGIKDSGNPDIGLLVCDGDTPASAVRFTATGTPAAPVLLSRERCRLGALRVVLANSGCANAATGRRGLDDAAKTQGAAALAAGVEPSEVAARLDRGDQPLSPGRADAEGDPRRPRPARREGDIAFQRAIETTDRFEKRANLEVELSSGTVRLCAQCKGAGMISPNFATMLCFVETDALLSAETADLLLGVCVKRSFDRASVDGQLSTNDTAILMCSGASGVQVAPESEDELRFGEALDALLRALAMMMVADGEGAGRIARVVVRGGHRDGAEAVARAVANSPLVKAALHGGGPQLGADRAGGRWRPGRADGFRRRSLSTSRSRGCRCARRAPRSPTTAPRWTRPSTARRSSTRSACRERGRRPRCSSPTSRTST